MELLKNKDPEAEELYRKIVVDRKATHEDENRMIQLNKIHCYNILSNPAEKIFKIERIKIESPVGY